MSSVVFQRGLCVALGVASVLAARPTLAAGKQGAVQFSLDGSLLKYQKTKVTVNVPDNQFASSNEATNSNTTYGPASSGLGVGIGYVATDNIIVGLRTAISALGTASNDVTVLPRFELLFDSGTSAPFLAAMVGIGHSSSTLVQSGLSTDISRTTYLLGGSAGVHAFVSDNCSFDPMFSVLGFTGSQTDGADVNTGDTRSADLSGIQVILSFGLSGWLGGKPPAPPPPVPEAESSEAPSAAPASAAPAGAGAVGVLTDDETDEAAQAPPGNDPNWVEVALPDQLVLHLQRTSHVERSTVSLFITEPKQHGELVGCAQIGVSTGGEALLLRETGRTEQGDAHSVSGKLALHALDVLADGSASFDICNHHYKLTDNARQAVRYYLGHRALGATESAPAPTVPAAPAPPPAVPAPAAAPPPVKAPPVVPPAAKAPPAAAFPSRAP